jgi:hypothetical protein
MADNTTINVGSGGDVIATDDLTTLNGGAVSGVKAQRVKPGFGADASFRDVSGAYPLPVDTDPQRLVTYDGRAATFRIPGRAGTTGQKIMSIFNATGSSVLVDVERITIDTAFTVIKAVTVLPLSIRLYRTTVLPTNGSAITKVPQDTSQTSSSSVTLLGDASADGTSSATALTATPSGILRQVFAPRLITAAGYEMLDTFTFFDTDSSRMTLRALEGIVVVLDYTLATQNPTTDMWVVDIKWSEYTLTT